MTSSPSLNAPELFGLQEPRLRAHLPIDAPGVYTDRAEATIELASAYGLDLDPWQSSFVLHTLAERTNGKWLHPTAAHSVPRQNGKNGELEAIELGGLLLFGERLIIHSAHEVKTALEAFRRIRDYFTNYDDLRKLVRAIRTTNGDEGIELLSGQRLRFMARSKSSGRGFSADRLILDEAQELAHATYAAILPAMSARPNPQVILTGTPPGPTHNGEVFLQTRTTALAGEPGAALYFEHSADPDLDHDDPVAAQQANPALGRRIEYETVLRERAAMSEEDFGRERLGKWDNAGGNAVIPHELWEPLASDEPTDDRDIIALAIDVAPDRSTTSIGLAGYVDDFDELGAPLRRPQLELIARRSGTGWIVSFVAGIVNRRNVRAVVIDAAGPGASLIEPLREAGVIVTTTSAQNMAAACGLFYDDVMSAHLRHLGDPQLATSLAAARKRSLGDAWAWHRKDATDITPLVAVTLARWGLTSTSVAAAKAPKAARTSSRLYTFS